jgi:hypothetical protein
MRTVISHVLILAAAGVLAMSGQQAISQHLTHLNAPGPNAVVKRPLDLLVKEFWACDYAATAHGILDKEAMMLCTMVSQQVKLAKFDGDFAAMLNWWRENKDPEHKALAAKLGALAQR